MGSGVWLEGRGISVDRFDRPAELYLLTHAHYDHMDGLRRGWERGPLVCSPLTARVVTRCLRIPEAQVRAIEPGEDARFPGVTVSALDARHIPGSLMFRLDFGDARIVFTGDMKAEPALVQEAAAWAGADELYVDATYGDPRYAFPTRAEAARDVVRLIREAGSREVFLALYTAGRIPLLQRVVAEIERPVYVSDAIYRSFDAMGLGALVTRDKESTNLRGYQRGYLEGAFLEYRKFRPREHVVIIPTGWTADAQPAHPRYRYVAYSDHSDSAELAAFLSVMSAREVIPIAGSISPPPRPARRAARGR